MGRACQEFLLTRRFTRPVSCDLKLEGAVKDTIKWLDASQEGSKEEYEEKQKELEGIAK